MIPSMMPGQNPQMPMNGMMMYNPMQGGNMGQNFNMQNKPNNMNNSGMKTKTDLNEKYKTERCRHYETHKNCALGDMCHFAHGDAELRKPDDPLNPE